MIAGMHLYLREQHIEQLRAQLLTREWLLASGLSSRQISDQLSAQTLVRVVPGCFVLGENWKELFAEDRLLMRVLAISAQPHSQRLVFCHTAAASIWGLPLYGMGDERVHLLIPDGGRGRSTTQIMRHSFHPIDEHDVVEIGGLLVTSLSRTIVDIARFAGAETAIGAADAGLRMLFGARRDAIQAQALEWKSAQVELLRNRPGNRGVRRAQAVIALCDPRADSVAESVSRLQLARLGIEFEIQVPVAGSDGSRYWVDFYFVGQGVFGEVDGAMKYVDERLRGGHDVVDVVLREKQREDDIRGVTGKRVVRWSPKHISSPAALGRLLRSFGIDMPRWL